MPLWRHNRPNLDIQGKQATLKQVTHTVILPLQIAYLQEQWKTMTMTTSRISLVPFSSGL